MDDFLKVGEDYLAHHGVLGMKWGVTKWTTVPYSGWRALKI